MSCNCNRIQPAVITPVLAAGSVASPYFVEVNITQRLCFPTCAENAPVIIRKSKFPQNPKRSVRFSGKRTKRSVQKRKARNTQKAETKVL